MSSELWRARASSWSSVETAMRLRRSCVRFDPMGMHSRAVVFMSRVLIPPRKALVSKHFVLVRDFRDHARGELVKLTKVSQDGVGMAAVNSRIAY